MSNMWSLWEDYEKRYNSWLKNSAVPKTTAWYQQSGIGEKLKSWDTGLLGQEERVMHPSEAGSFPGSELHSKGVFTKRHGGVFGQGGKVDQYLEPRNVRTMHPTEGVQVGKELPSMAVRDAKKFGSAALLEYQNLYNSVAEKYFSKFTIKDEQGNVIRKNGKIQLSPDKDAEVKSAIEANKSTLPPQLGGTSTAEQAKVFTEQDANSLSKFAGVNFKDVKKNWAKKGGMDGLMANPAFTLGLALMQSSAQGKRVGSGVLDNFVKSAGLSEHYKNRLKSRRNLMGPVTDDQRAMAFAALPTSISAPGIVEATLGSGDELRGHNAALDKIYTNVFMRKSATEDWDYSKGMQQISGADFKKEYDKLLASNQISVVKGKTISYLSTGKKGDKEYKSQFDDILSDIGGYFKKKHKQIFMERAEGGPVQAGQPYIVGEKGPEVVIPKADANVVSNDDSQVMGMLLASNPQLQNVSKARAESILRSRFPDYFA